MNAKLTIQLGVRMRIRPSAACAVTPLYRGFGIGWSQYEEDSFVGSARMLPIQDLVATSEILFPALPVSPAMSARLLIVDDSKCTREMISYTLRELGYMTVEAEHGQDAIRTLKTLAAVDAMVEGIVTDLHMPVMDGLRLVRHLRADQDYKFIPIVTLSSDTTTEMKSAVRAAGASAWLSKPFNPELMQKVLKQLIRQRQGEPVATG